MRLEFNPRALCYNLYCDTREEQEKMKQMLERSLTATDIKSIDNMIYADTDSVKTMKTKLNSVYGRLAMMNKDYIVIHRGKQPTVIFKSAIIAVEQDMENKAIIHCSKNVIFYTDEKTFFT